MIQIQTTRAGVIWLAATVDDGGYVTSTCGLTQESASRRLCRKAARS